MNICCAGYNVTTWRALLAEYGRRIGLGAAFLVPLGLLHAFLLAEIGVFVVDVLFVSTMWQTRQFAWCRQAWFVVAIIWWGWLLICSLPLPALGLHGAGWMISFVQAFVIIRFLLFTAALQSWLLTTERVPYIAFWLLAASCLWIGLEAWQQFLFGHNIFGDTRWPDGALTGPFWKPRAGALFGHLLFAVLPAAAFLLRREAAATALLALGLATSVLIGQRMGTAFAVLGNIVMATCLPRLRRPAVVALLVAGLVLLATPLISPPTHAKLIGETAQNMGNFAQSPYGELFTRALTMGLASPWDGWGYNGFRAFCPEAQFSGGFPAFGIAPTSIALAACNLHPHNFYLQALTDAGFPGLVLFIALNVIWLFALGRGLRRNPAPLRVGLFIGVLTYAWPFASMDAFPTLYEPGWLFFILGLGLAAAAMDASSPAA
jgi:O-antigen ligase